MHRLSELTHDSSLRTQRLSLPQFCTQSPKWQKRGFDKCQKAHYVIEAHAEALGLKERGLLRSHPNAVERVHFTLFRDRAVSLQTKPDELRTSALLCDGRRMCARGGKSASVQHAAKMWRGLAHRSG